jgi:sterol 14alpha-demethylase
MSRFRVIVDPDVCQGHGVCLAEAPDLFAIVDRKGPYPLARLKAAIVEGDMLEAARRAAQFCPNQSIRIVAVEES